MISPAHFANSRPQQHLTTAGYTPCSASNPGTAISNPYLRHRFGLGNLHATGLLWAPTGCPAPRPAFGRRYEWATPWPPGAHSPARRNSHVNGSLDYPAVSAKNRGVSPVGWGHMCQNDSPCMMGRVGSKRLWVRSLLMENPQQPTRRSNEREGGGGHPGVHANFTERLWNMSSLGTKVPLWKREGPPRVAGDHCKWFKVGLILTHGQKSSHCSLLFRSSPLHKGANLSFGASLSLSLWNTCQTAFWTRRAGLRFTAYRTHNIS